MQRDVIFGEDYELIDCGGYEKLERFGRYVLRRPEPQAIWPKSLAESEWLKADAAFLRSDAHKADGLERGEWQNRRGMPEQWFINYRYKDMHLSFRLGKTSFKHVGIFPEQAHNWNFLYDGLQQMQGERKVLNLFAYTGGASLAAKAAGADVTHLDAVKQVVSWARENMEASKLDHIRWMVEDALVYIRREAKRGKLYQGIVLDPPAYGRGPKGEKWLLEEGIAPLMEACAQVLDPRQGLVVLNLYSMGFSATVAANLLHRYFPYVRQIEQGELCFQDRSGTRLPLSVYARFLHQESSQ